MTALIAASVFSSTASAAEFKCDGLYGEGAIVFTFATDGPGELGLLEALGEAVGKEQRAKICWVKAGTGDSLALLKEKKVDMIMVHAPEAKRKAVAGGWAIKRTFVGSNEFYLVGPPQDPACVAQANNVADAYQRIASAQQGSSPGETTREHTRKDRTSGEKQE